MRRASSARPSQLRKDLAFAENAAKALETIRGELAIDIAQRRAQISDLEGRLNQETVETKSLRDENERLKTRQATIDKHIVQVEIRGQHPAAEAGAERGRKARAADGI